MIKIPSNLKENIEAYCKLNEVEDVNDFVIKCTKDGINIRQIWCSTFFTKITNTRSSC